jgi:hypothetical protein
MVGRLGRSGVGVLVDALMRRWRLISESGRTSLGDRMGDNIGVQGECLSVMKVTGIPPYWYRS